MYNKFGKKNIRCIISSKLKLLKKQYLFLGFGILIFMAGCKGSSEEAEKETITSSKLETVRETIALTPTPEVIESTKPVKQTESNTVQMGNEPTPQLPEPEPTVDPMQKRRQEVIAYEREKYGYSLSEQGECYLNSPCGYCGVTDVYIDKYGACAICYDEYLQPEFGWCEICGTPLTMLQSSYKRCWECMKCQYCGIDMSSYINYDTGGIDSVDGTWICWDCYDHYNQDDLPLCVICGVNPQFDLSIGTCLECYEKENGSYYQNCAICGMQITPHNSALLNDQWVCFDCYDANS